MERKEKRREREMSGHNLSMLCRESLPALTEINLVTINRDTRTQRRQPEAKSQSDEVGRSGGGGEEKASGEKQAKTIKMKRGRGETERQWGGRGPGGVGVLRERFYHSYYFEETALICTPPEQLMSVIHQRDAFMRRCRGNIMPTALSL